MTFRRSIGKPRILETYIYKSADGQDINMLICLGCKRIIAHVTENVKYDVCSTCLFIETEFVPAEELVAPTTEIQMVE